MHFNEHGFGRATVATSQPTGNFAWAEGVGHDLNRAEEPFT